MIELFGKQPEMAGALLEFLQVLAEEYAGNMKIEVKNDFATGKAADGSGQAEKVVGLLGMYVTAPGKLQLSAPCKELPIISSVNYRNYWCT